MDIREFRNNIVNTINQSSMPLDVIELVLRDLLNSIHQQVESLYAQADAEAAEKAKSEEEKPAKSTRNKS